MTGFRKAFEGPYFDPTGLGFLPPAALVPCRRALAVMTICWSPVERAAIFVNADGLCIPLEVHPYAIRQLLARATHVEFGKVSGTGQFAMSPTARRALELGPGIKQWAVYSLPQPAAGYVNDDQAWAAHVEERVAEERRSVAAELQERKSAGWLQSERRQVSGYWFPSLDEVEAERRAYIKALPDVLNAERAQWLAADARINAWLRGDVGSPPLLAAMTGAAA